MLNKWFASSVINYKLNLTSLYGEEDETNVIAVTRNVRIHVVIIVAVCAYSILGKSITATTITTAATTITAAVVGITVTVAGEVTTITSNNG